MRDPLRHAWLHADLLVRLDALGPSPDRVAFVRAVQEWVQTSLGGSWHDALRRRWGPDELRA